MKKGTYAWKKKPRRDQLGIRKKQKEPQQEPVVQRQILLEPNSPLKMDSPLSAVVNLRRRSPPTSTIRTADSTRDVPRWWPSLYFLDASHGRRRICVPLTGESGGSNIH